MPTAARFRFTDIHEVSVDANGYWVVDGAVLTDQYGNPIEVTTDETAIFREISRSDDGYLRIKLGNGEELSLPIFNAFNLLLQTETVTLVERGTSAIAIPYSVEGADADKAIVAISQVEAVSAAIDTVNKTITVNFENGFEEGHIIVSAYNLEHLVLRPILFKSK